MNLFSLCSCKLFAWTNEWPNIRTHMQRLNRTQWIEGNCKRNHNEHAISFSWNPFFLRINADSGGDTTSSETKPRVKSVASEKHVWRVINKWRRIHRESPSEISAYLFGQNQTNRNEFTPSFEKDIEFWFLFHSSKSVVYSETDRYSVRIHKPIRNQYKWNSYASQCTATASPPSLTMDCGFFFPLFWHLHKSSYMMFE